MQEAKVNGFEFTMFYVGLGDYRLNIERVAVRVKNGGHHIASEDIMRRHETSLRNLLTHLHLIDHLIVIDNSESNGEIVLEADYGEIKTRALQIPQWVEWIEQQLNN
jgi:predicted ABC-type ATPase